MGKRSCPFELEFRPQMKIHVSDKEISNGVSKNEHMKRVYDKTINLLYKGAKSAARQTLSEDPLLTLSVSDVGPISSAHHDSFKQMRLTKDCLLELASKAPETTLTFKACTMCKVSGQTDINSCAFCDKILCSTCQHQCNKCDDNFCNSCCFELYDGVEGYLCRNCC